MFNKRKILFLIIAVGMLSGCQHASVNNQETDTAKAITESIPWAQNYDSEDTGVLVNIDDSDKTITIKKIDSGEAFKINYVGATDVTDKYSSILAMKQVEIGELVNIYYNSEDSTVRKLEISPDAWEYTGVENLTIDRTEKIMTIAGEKYKYGDSFTLISNDEEIDLIDFNPIDIVTVKGYNKKICSVIVTRGHGYITLENDETFIGGWIDVGKESVKPITEDMLIVASEGNHKVTVANEGAGGSKSVSIKRNETSVVDVGDLKSETPKSGSLKFKITPNTASLYLDGILQDYSEVIVEEYGSHRILVKADGYEDFGQTLVVGSPYAEIEIDATGSANSSSSDTAGSKGTTGTTTGTTGTATDATRTTDATDGATGAPSDHTGLDLPELNAGTGTTGLADTTGTADTTDATGTTDSSALVDVIQSLLTY
ncbi:MAG: hypothetical protein ACERKN_21875 [Velocimicrobium sp.]